MANTGAVHYENVEGPSRIVQMDPPSLIFLKSVQNSSISNIKENVDPKVKTKVVKSNVRESAHSNEKKNIVNSGSSRKKYDNTLLTMHKETLAVLLEINKNLSRFADNQEKLNSLLTEFFDSLY